MRASHSISNAQGAVDVKIENPTSVLTESDDTDTDRHSRNPQTVPLKPQTVHIEVLGDEKVGKTSLICSLVSRHFNERVPPTLLNVQIPAEESDEDVVISITDTSSTKPVVQRVTDATKRSDAILLVYDLTRLETFHRVQRWLELIAKQKPVAVVLVANKADLCGSIQKSHSSYANQMRHIFNKYEFVVATVECSTKVFAEVARAFYLAQKAVLYPREPLYNSKERKIQPKCVKAIRRVFRLYNRAGNGIMTREELNDYQQDCFGVRLLPEELDTLVEYLSHTISSGVTQDSRGLYFEGFLHLWKLFIDRNRPESCWQVLRSLGYSNNLILEIPSGRITVPTHEENQTAKLSVSATEYLTRLFSQFDVDRDGYLSDHELADIFSIVDDPQPPWLCQSNQTLLFEKTLVQGKDAISLKTWLACWLAVAQENPQHVLKVLFYLGYDDKEAPAIEYTKRFTKHGSPMVRCFLVGGTRSDRLRFLQPLVCKQSTTLSPEKVSSESNPADANDPERLSPDVKTDTFAELETAAVLQAVNEIDTERDGKKYLLISEVKAQFDSMAFEEIEKRADIICFLYNPMIKDAAMRISDIDTVLDSSIARQYIMVRPDNATDDEWRNTLLRSEHSSQKYRWQPFDPANPEDTYRKLVRNAQQTRPISSSSWSRPIASLIAVGVITTVGLLMYRRPGAMEVWLAKLSPAITELLLRTHLYKPTLKFDKNR
uniref:Mitochondrial Rho GTPase putative n=1 Tax=Albugo laibachii Nc14 TaxID=890382 RepID=F0W0P5_9STRA|nr:mitochondrial Rho GTPase putative [Albugo laibachii Nc14]|eukprot:CCA14619.1 mitochondrial Rho GTPase putative [Albugo laibachii Nc14]